ncbi:MAG: transcriptional regulator [Gammaproteobacteria bacterium]|nr:transcriptional regulator [Gammaproteobacteria bacterium]
MTEDAESGRGGTRPGRPARGSSTGRPIMALLDVLGQRWMLRILWELRAGRTGFRGLRDRCDGISPTVLNQRLKTLRALDIIDLDSAGYGLTPAGRELGEQLLALDGWARRWAATLTPDQSG